MWKVQGSCLRPKRNACRMGIKRNRTRSGRLDTFDKMEEPKLRRPMSSGSLVDM